MSDRADPWAGTTYNGFAGAAEPPRPPGRGPIRRLSRNLLLGGVAAAVGLGLAFGLAARPNLGQNGVKPAPMQPVARPSTEVLDIEVTKPVVLPAPKPTGRLEVLPPDLARAAPRMAAVVPSSPVTAPRIEPRSARDAGFDCRSAGSVAEQMVCADPGLSRADRRLQRAYERARQAGAMSRRELRDEQQDWLAIREDAARRSPDAIRSVYEQRIDELNALAGSGSG